MWSAMFGVYVPWRQYLVKLCYSYILTIPKNLQPEKKYLLLSLYVLVEKNTLNFKQIFI